jgi:phosphatidylglycerophosphatase A
MKLKLRPGSLPPDRPLHHPASLIATVFGVGLMPIASGTWGSLAALPVGWLVGAQWGTAGLLIAVVVTTAAGIWAGDVLVRASNIQDPGFIVIDEVAGMLITLMFAPLTWWGVLTAFLLFRAADIVKPFPANWCDRHVHGGLGVMLDDLVAGAYAGVATYLISEYVLGDLATRFGF